MVAAGVLDPAIDQYVGNSALGPIEVWRGSRFGLKSLTRYERHVFLGVVEWFSHFRYSLVLRFLNAAMPLGLKPINM
jgi:hypothetical protein